MSITNLLKNNNSDSKKFEAECMEFIDALYSSAIKMTRNETEAMELVQDTYLRAFRFRHNFEQGTNLKAWLFRILTNTFINNYRHKQYENRYMERAATEPIYDELLNKEAREYDANPENHIFAKYLRNKLESELLELPEDFRMVVILSDIQGFSYKEISHILDTPIGTIMSRLHRGRKMLQRQLVDYAIAAGILPENKKQTITNTENIVQFKNIMEAKK
jgi:RNA polymerase sigma-70 factor, ECF subfamily